MEMTMNKLFKDEGDRQEQLRAFVSREVIYCVSYLIDELAQKSEYMDELMEVCTQDDWQSAAEEEGYRVIREGDGYCWTGPSRDEDPDDSPENWTCYETEHEAWRSACEDNDIDPHTNEAYEHWIVSDWLAKRLAAKGEMVIMGFLGMDIWGRTCSGQAIFLDQVIEDIYVDLHGGKDVNAVG